jgi:acetylornithine deacetylase/succinyl-diaminopimelate desuccinylase-like protein
MDASEAKQRIEEQLDYGETRRLLVKLVQTPSPQTELLEKEPRVLSLIRDVVGPELEAEGIRPVLDGMGNLTARLSGNAKAGGLVLVSYAMNAAPGTMPRPYSGEIVDGKPYRLEGECVWGRGACEQKGSLAAMLMAVKLLARNKWELPGDLYFVTSTAGESGKHESLDYVLSHDGIEAKWGIIDGPPEIQLGNKGRIDVRIIVRGRQAHSSRPWDGINAVEGAVKVLEKLGPLMPYPENKSHPDLGRVSLTPTAIESYPRATHTIPGECRIRMDRRLLPGDDPDEAVRQLSEAIGRIDPYDVTLEKEEFMYACEVGRDAGVVIALANAVRTMLGREPEYSFSTAANDTGLLNVKGIETVNYGSRAVRFQHTDNDLVSIKSVVEAAEVYMFMALCR